MRAYACTIQESGIGDSGEREESLEQAVEHGRLLPRGRVGPRIWQQPRGSFWEKGTKAKNMQGRECDGEDVGVFYSDGFSFLNETRSKNVRYKWEGQRREEEVWDGYSGNIIRLCSSSKASSVVCRHECKVEPAHTWCAFLQLCLARWVQAMSEGRFECNQG